MKIRILVAALVGAAVALVAFHGFEEELIAFSNGNFDASGRDGFNCSACHSGATGSSVAYGIDPVNMDDPPIETGYVPGATYDVTVIVTGGPGVKHGFAWDTDDGTGILTDPVNVQKNANAARPANFTHTSTGNALNTWTFQWVAPDDIRTISFWGSGNSANGNNNPGGDAPTSTVTLAADPVVGDEILCRRGNVNEAAGRQQNVLLLNGSPGTGAERSITLTQSDPFLLEMFEPNSIPGGPAPFVLYFYVGQPTAATVRTLPKQLGLFCMPSPLTDASIPSLKKIANNIGKQNKLGVPNIPSTPAPSTVLNKPNGIGKTGTVFLQGLILDNFSPNGQAAVTNGLKIVLTP